MKENPTEKLRNQWLKEIQKNPRLGQRIKQLRVNDEYTWRAVAGQIAQEYPDIGVDVVEWYGFMGGNQIDGMTLCEAAMEYFCEEPDDGWN